ncbi:MAG: RluA family pseudouridine synthase [Proteobacteria bacterium]|nr:RluA family pseudouridine synthase [Pseudomonadota bacterium]
MTKQAVRIITIDEEKAGQRIDNFLKNVCKGVPTSHIYRLLRTGQIRVNKKRIKAPYRLMEGDELRLPPMEVAHEAPKKFIGSSLLQEIESRILYEDDKLMVVNKPAGIAVHGGSGVNLGMIEVLRQLRPRGPSLELAHRLDRETSGVLIIAKKRKILKELHELLRSRAVTKEYEALLHGILPKTHLKVDVPLLKNTLTSGERMVKVDKTGKSAVTHFELQESFPNASYVKIRIESGRTHQIRVHAQHIKHSIVGDEKYGHRESDKALVPPELSRLYLHAKRISFTLSDGTKMDIEAPLDEKFKKMIRYLGGLKR